MKGPAILSILLAILNSGLVVDGKMQKRKQPEKWRALHLLNYQTDEQLAALAQQLPDLTAMGINTLILEVDYGFQFASHPELRLGRAPITREGARRFAAACRKNHLRLIPEFQSLGHQSWKRETYPLLKLYPKFDLTPNAFPNNDGIYCREWDPLNPEVDRIVFQLMDEIIDAFQADALHAGMDEVFLLGSEQSPSTKGKDPAVLFARAVNDIYNHLVKRRHVEMLIWADRLFDGTAYNWGEWESSRNGTARAVDMIPTDIILCPWHYETAAEYPSVPLFLKKGFRVLPASYKDLDAQKALIEYSFKNDSPNRMLGHLFTSWGGVNVKLNEYTPVVEGLKVIRSVTGERE